MNQKIVVLNGQRVNYDGSIDYSVLGKDVSVYDTSTPDEILDRIADCGIVVTKEMPLPGDLIRSFPDSVKLICEAGTGYNNIDLAAAKEKGITVCNVPAYSTQRVAHTVIGLMLSLSSSLHIQQRMLERGDRSNFTDCLRLRHEEVNGKILGIVGAGTIGREVMKIARVLDMEILAYTRTPRADEEGIHYTDLKTVLSESDFVSLHCPLTDATYHMIDREALGLMKPSAYIINTARGALIDEKALIEAIKEGRLAGAALDVQETEPPAEDSPLYTMDQILLTPHMGWKGLETRQRLVALLKKNIDAFLAEAPINVIC